MNPCSARKMREAYNEMVRVNCRNCDLYFHCIGNYKAVRECSGSLQHFTATIISNGREWSDQLRGRSDSGSSRNDQEANEYGRNGGNCAARYLSATNCAYNPRTKQCKWRRWSEIEFIWYSKTFNFSMYGQLLINKLFAPQIGFTFILLHFWEIYYKAATPKNNENLYWFVVIVEQQFIVIIWI